MLLSAEAEARIEEASRGKEKVEVDGGEEEEEEAVRLILAEVRLPGAIDHITGLQFRWMDQLEVEGGGVLRRWAGLDVSESV